MATASAASLGLVSVQTSRPRAGLDIDKARLLERLEGEGGFLLDPQGLRIRRLRMHVGVAARMHAVSQHATRRERAVMVTLTYRGDNSDWCAKHIAEAVQRFRKWCARRGIACRYVWVAELQQRGVIHYHLVAWLPRSVSMPKWDKQGWWPHGMTRTEVARHAVPYLLKYLSKDASKSFGGFPRGARIYGVGGLDASLRRARAWLSRPAFLQGSSSVDDVWRRATGGGWVDRSTGEHVPSEFRSICVSGARAVVRVYRHPVLIQAAGPFSWWAPGVLEGQQLAQVEASRSAATVH